MTPEIATTLASSLTGMLADAGINTALQNARKTAASEVKK